MHSLFSDPRSETLARIHAALIARFGRIPRHDDRRRDPVWTLVQGVIGARTKTHLSNANTDALLARWGSWEAVARAPEAGIAEVLSSATFPAMVSARLKACLSAIAAERGAVDLRHVSNLPTDTAMDWLETLPGVGRKIAAGVMNTSRFDRRALVIDGHHRRVMQRTGLVPPRADTARAYAALMPLLPGEWSARDVDEHHLLVKRLGQTHCRPSGLHCDSCPIRAECETGKQRA
ncbi:endonuclease III domain-containing protein [Aurantiacibacter spongiae]|uniref:endonuclease III domain-containing protein n=1 Tax=Aurantiacibacter spongiae TaxID=2488860 RepID=UPI0018F8758A|nr:endonuclease III [Aurantiacibacter spongiae]